LVSVGNREACVLLSVCEAQTRCSSRDFTSWAKSNGVAVVGSSPAGLLDYKALRCRWPAALVIKSEKRGLSEHLVETADFMVRILMRGGCDSINVSVAAGVLLFEMSNQRRGSLRAIPQGIQAGELPATAHFCLFAETRSSTSFVRALCMLTVSSMRGTMARISQNSRSHNRARSASFLLEAECASRRRGFYVPLG
jgi:SpoU rRNA methylase family protein